ncbi:Uma2 family endonuclease [Cohnella zeiphila]|uniref:Uma2 family endonuclease n=1 Tax=Cohnella zeiphila TaxID=2761120 RepID=UPI002355CDC5|nr:Uma2 family endonuclease [Cohnella zeiphila]
MRWPEGTRMELIGGEPHAMTPAPSRQHQRVLGALFVQFSNFLHGKSCEVYAVPFDVRLPEGGEADEDTMTVVQPDITLVCDPSKLDDRGCKGAPDLVVEVISPASIKLDLTVKKSLYERAGVKEYWIVYPAEKIILVHLLNGEGKYESLDTYSADDTVTVSVLPGMSFATEEIF